jgi:hypothetical protein
VNLETYLSGRKKDKRELFLKVINKATFQIAEVVQLSQSVEVYERFGAYTKTPGGPKTVHLRLQAVAEGWMRESCQGRFIRMRGPTAWGFELVEDAILFKLTWGHT